MYDQDAMAFRPCLARGNDEDLVAVGFNEMALVYPFLKTSEFGALCFCGEIGLGRDLDRTRIVHLQNMTDIRRTQCRSDVGLEL